MDESGYQSPFQPLSSYDFYDAEGRDAHHALKASAHHGGWGSFGQTQSEAQNLHPGAIRRGRHEKPEGCSIQPAPAEAPNQILDFRQQGTQQPVSAFDPNQESGTSYRQFEYASAAYCDTARHLTHMQFAPNDTPGPSHATHTEPYPHNVANLSYLAPYSHCKDYRMSMVSGSNWENRPAFPSHSNQRPELKHDATPYRQHQHHHSATSTIANQPMTAPIAMLREIPSDVNAAPWNSFVAVEGGGTTGDVRPMQTGSGQYFSDTTHSSSAFNNIGKSRLVRSDCGTPCSSTARSYNPMPGAMLTGRSYQLDSLTPPHNFPTPSRRAFSRQDTQSTFGRVETPARMRQHPNTQPRLEPDYQSLPQNQRRLSSAISQTTEASTIGTASNSTDGVLECSFPDCGATFNGKWNRGNRSRHERTCHGDAAPLQCEYSPCKKTFKRSDARSKHYKKHHQEPAANSSSVRRPAREDQDVALKGISTWYT